MRNVWTIAKRELNLYLISPIAYVVAFIIMLVIGLIFYVNMLAAVLNQFPPTVQVVISPLVTLFLFTTPAVTMRTIADEQRMGTMETLLTAPVRDWELVVGKWLGAVLFYLAIIALTLVFPIVMNVFVKPGIDQGLMVSGYLGVILLVSAFVSIGIFASSLFSNQIAAFFTAIGILLVLWMIAYPNRVLPSDGAQFLAYLDLSEHFYPSFLRGIINLKDVVFYLSVTILSLFLGTMSVETRRWR